MRVIKEQVLNRKKTYNAVELVKKLVNTYDMVSRQGVLAKIQQCVRC